VWSPGKICRVTTWVGLPFEAGTSQCTENMAVSEMNDCRGPFGREGSHGFSGIRGDVYLFFMMVG
jgi:hypothetical protein